MLLCSFALHALKSTHIHSRASDVNKCEAIFHKVTPGALRPDHMNSKLHWVLPSLRLHKARISSTQRQCLLSDVTATAEWSPNTTCFLFFLHFSLFSLSASVSIERKKHMFPSKGRHIKHKLSLVNGWVLFQGQSETLSGQQRAIRALAPTQAGTEYIWSVNICSRRINGLDRPLITH